LLVLLTVFALGLVVAIGGRETGAAEKLVLGVGLAGVIALAAPVRRIGTST
jgi:hypothetical protein